MNKISQIVNFLELKLKDNLIHEFQPGVIYTYRDLPKLVKQNQISIYKTGNFSIKDTFYLFSKMPVENIRKILLKQSVLSPLYIAAFNPEKRCETSYLLSEVLDRQYYETSKKFRKYVTKGLTFFKRSGFSIRPLKSYDAEEAIRLYRRWVKYKYENYNIFRIMFPEKRYERCLLSSFKSNMGGEDYYSGSF